MNVILVLNRERKEDARFVVNLHRKSLRAKVISLLENDKGKEAFDLMMQKAQITEYIPPGQIPSVKPSLILHEEFL